jgi:putative aldouronate transport system substrate-binding protein
MRTPPLRRRTLLRTAGAGALAFAGGGLLAACGERSGGGGEAEDVQQFEHLVPRYVAWNGVQLPEADLLPGATNEHGFSSPPGLIRYPQNRVRAVAEPFGNGNTYTAMTPLWSPPPDYPNDYFRAIEERTGTKLDFSPRDGIEYQDILTAVLGAQDHPHLTMIPGWNVNFIPRIADAVENLFADLTPILAGDVAERWPLLANLPTPAWLECIWNGKLKCLPQVEANPFGNPLFARKDILDELGLPYPTNAEELLEIGRELTSPRDNRWAFGNMDVIVNPIFRVPYQDWRRESDGSLVNSIETEELRASLEFQVQLYQEELVHPDNAASAEADMKTLFRNGQLIFRTDGMGDWSEALGSGVLDDNPNYNQQPAPAFAHDGGTPQVNGADPAWAFTFLHRDLSREQIEEILDVANWLAAPFGTEEYELHQYGVEGVHFERAADGQPELNDQGSAEAGQPVPTYYFASGRPAEPIAPGGDWPGYVESRIEWNNQHIQYLVPGIFQGLKRIEPANLQQANQVLDDKLQDVRRGRTPLSELDQIMADWRREGGDEGREFYQEALAARDEAQKGGA